MNKTQIEWVKNPDGTQGYTWNPITGCLNGCEYCYARKLANTRLKTLYLANSNLAPSQFGTLNPSANELYNPFYPRFWEDRFYNMPMSGEPKGIFVCDMSDLFGIGIPEQWTRKVLLRIQMSEKHRFYLLTKQPQNLIKWSPFPDNCRIGVSATDRKMVLLAVEYLNQIKATVKYLSLEPLLDWVLDAHWGLPFNFSGIDQVIIGAQTKPYKPPKIEWVREIVEAADKAGIPVFLKDNLKPLLQQNDHNIYSYPEWAGKQFAVTGDHSLAPVSPHSNEAMRDLRQEQPK